MNIAIRRVKRGEVLALQNIARATFTEAFGAQNFAVSLDKYLTEKLSVEQIQKELGTKDSAYYFAVQDGSIVGYLKLNQGAAQTEMSVYMPSKLSAYTRSFPRTGKASDKPSMPRRWKLRRQGILHGYG